MPSLDYCGGSSTSLFFVFFFFFLLPFSHLPQSSRVFSLRCVVFKAEECGDNIFQASSMFPVFFSGCLIKSGMWEVGGEVGGWGEVVVVGGLKYG